VLRGCSARDDVSTQPRVRQPHRGIHARGCATGCGAAAGGALPADLPSSGSGVRPLPGWKVGLSASRLSCELSSPVAATGSARRRAPNYAQLVGQRRLPDPALDQMASRQSLALASSQAIHILALSWSGHAWGRRSWAGRVRQHHRESRLFFWCGPSRLVRKRPPWLGHAEGR
jgi:hypothetical protein